MDCIEELKQISDLTQPHNWYASARDIHRKIIFHAGLFLFLKILRKLFLGPTNSGKTFSALERFKESSSGVYCAPLRLLATEIFYKMNDAGNL